MSDPNIKKMNTGDASQMPEDQQPNIRKMNMGDASQMPEDQQPIIITEDQQPIVITVDDEESPNGETGAEGTLKKGPWTAAEDEILIEYVNKHGEGNWNGVQKNSGLARCGKSCRLRWANHLRPDLKKGAFSLEEERKIIELHSKIGNKWARMATELPGRTDNEIKNYWNTRIKRMQRLGESIYPDDILCQRIMNGGEENPNVGTLMNDTSQHTDHSPANSFNVPDIDFKLYNFDRSLLPYVPSVLDILETNLFAPISDSEMFPVLTHPPELQLIQHSDMFYNSLDSNSGSYFAPPLTEYPAYYTQPESSQQFSAPCDPNLITYCNNNQFPVDNNNLHTGSHTDINGNTISSSLPIPEAMKMELPSLQYFDPHQGSWGTPSSSLPSLESVDTFGQSSSSPIEQYPSFTYSRQSSGLLESIVESQIRKVSSNDSFFDPMPLNNEVVQSSTFNTFEPEWDVCSALCCSPVSEYTPHMIDTTQGYNDMRHETVSQAPPYNLSQRGHHDMRHEMVSQAPQYNLSQNTEETPNSIPPMRPDAMLDKFWFYGQ